MNLSPDDETLVRKAMAAGDTALLQILGEHVAQSTPGVAPRDIEALIALGRQQLRTMFKEMRAQLCSEPFREKLRDIDDGDERKAVLTIMDIVMDRYGMPPAIYASVLLCRGLLDTWCSEEPR